MTYPDQREYLKQMEWMPIVKIQKDIHFIMNMLATYLYRDEQTHKTTWKWQADFDEGDSQETVDMQEFWQIRDEAIKNGIQPPIEYGNLIFADGKIQKKKGVK